MGTRLSRRAFGSLLGSAGLALGATALPRHAQAHQVKEFWHYLGARGEIEAVNALLDVANKQHPDTPITGRVIPGSAAGVRQQVQVSLMGGVQPVSYQLSAGYDLRTVADSGRLVEISDVWKDIDGDTIFPAGLRRVMGVGTSHYAVPIGIGILGNVYYNKEVFDRLNLKVPTTWPDFTEVAKTLKGHGIGALSSASGPSWTTYQFYGPLVTALGIDGCWNFMRGNVAFNGPEMMQAFQLFRTSMATYFDPSWTGAKWSDGVDQLMRGRLGMYSIGDWASGYMKQRGWTPGKEYDFFPLPGLQKVTITQSDIAVVLKGEEEQTGRNFLRSVASVQGQEAFAKLKGALSANRQSSPDIYDAFSRRNFDKLNNPDPGYTVFPNLYLALPTGFNLDFGNAVERFAGTLDEKDLRTTLDGLEAKRQELKRGNQFMEL